jgi:penicillin-insensitive murein endopeptidase
LVGDMSQPRGGPMVNGHTSHQVGLDADIWLTPMPDRILTPQEREDMNAVSMLKDPFTVDPEVFTELNAKLIKRAASYPQVARIFVHPAIKKALCQMAPQLGKDRAWLGKVRPWWNHHYHFHVRLACPPGVEGCENQKGVAGDDGCGQELVNWYAMLKKSAIATAQAPTPGAKTWVGKPPLTMAQLPKECASVLTAGGFEPPIPAEGETLVRSEAALAALATKDAGPPVPVLTPAQLAALTGAGGGMPLPDRNPKR